jgi:cell division septation protein DedD
MANYHREVYQPSFKDGPAYDLQDDEEDDSRTRLPLLIVIALLVLASFAGVVWLAYNQGLERGLVAAHAVINAPNIPIRTLPPEDTASVLYTGLKIYNDPIPPDEEAEDSNLASVPPSLDSPAPQPEPLPTPPSAVATPAPAPTTETTRTPIQTASATAATPRGAVLQIGAYPSEALALEAWENFQAQHTAFASGLIRRIQRADLGESGIWYRVRVGPYADDVSASASCESLIANGGSCFVVAP